MFKIPELLKQIFEISIICVIRGKKMQNKPNLPALAGSTKF